MSPGGRWVLAGDRSSATAAARAIRDGNADRALSFSPAAYHELTKADVPVVPSFRYLSLEGLNELGREDRSIARSLVEMLEAVRSDKSGLYGTPSSAFRPFEAAEYQLKHSLDALRFRDAELRHFLETERPTSLLVPRRYDAGSDLEDIEDLRAHPLLWPADPLVSTAVLLKEAQLEPPVRWYSVRRRESESEGRSFLLDSLRTAITSIFPENFLDALRIAPALTLSSMLSPGRSPTLAVADRNSEILALVRHGLQTHELNLDWWRLWQSESSDLSLLYRTTEVNTDASGVEARQPDIDRETLDRLCEEAGLEKRTVRRVFVDRLEVYASDRVPLLAQFYSRALRYLSSRRPRAVLTGVLTGDGAQVIRQAAEETGVPLVCFQHGGNYGYIDLPHLAASDLRASILCVYGPGVAEILGEQANGMSREVDVESVGRPPEVRVRRGGSQPNRVSDRENVKRLVYVATGFVGDMRYGPNYWYDDTAYFLHQVQLLRVLAKTPGFTTRIVKLHPKDKLENPLADHLRDEDRTVFDVRREGTLDDFLSPSDVVVLDWPSTTLIEVLEAGCSVVYIDMGYVEWIPEAMALLQQGAWVIEKERSWEDRLRTALRAAAAGSESSPTGKTSTFLKRYACQRYEPDSVLRRMLESKSPGSEVGTEARQTMETGDDPG